MFDGQPKETIFYQTVMGECPLVEWISDLRDRQAVARIQKRLIRLQAGNPGDYKSVGAGVYELRIDYAAGYRLYFAFSGTQIILLLCGGTKPTQDADIAAALDYWREFQHRGKA